MAEPLIRDATAADAPGIAAIWNPIIRDTTVTYYPHERPAEEIATMIAQRQAQGWAFLVAETPEILGFASFFQFRGGPGYARSMELTINLAPEARGQGLGARLMRALEARATAHGARLMVGGIDAANTGSIEFHRRMGYREMGRLPDAGWKFGRFHELVLMGRLLGHDTTAPPG